MKSFCYSKFAMKQFPSAKPSVQYNEAYFQGWLKRNIFHGSLHIPTLLRIRPTLPVHVYLKEEDKDKGLRSFTLLALSPMSWEVGEVALHPSSNTGGYALPLNTKSSIISLRQGFLFLISRNQTNETISTYFVFFCVFCSPAIVEQFILVQ